MAKDDYCGKSRLRIDPDLLDSRVLPHDLLNRRPLHDKEVLIAKTAWIFDLNECYFYCSQ